MIGTGEGKAVDEIKSLGFEHYHVRISRLNNSILDEVIAAFDIFRLCRNQRPDILHLVTLKPMLYGGTIARLLKLPAVVFAVAGLGNTFVENNLKVKALRIMILSLFSWIFKHHNFKIVFQNKDDLALLKTHCRIPDHNVTITHGSGVSLSVFKPPRKIKKSSTPVVLFAARLLINKGVLDLIEAARILNQKKVRVKVRILGPLDNESPRSISCDVLLKAEFEGLIEYGGKSNDIPGEMNKASVFAYPSYYGEGVPKVLLEAAASGLPIVTTDHPGCRDAIIDKITGVLVPVKSPGDLACAIEQLLKDKSRLRSMGKSARLLAEKNFSVSYVVAAHTAVYDSLLMSKKKDVQPDIFDGAARF